MQQTIRTITQQLLNQIRDEQLHYTPRELQEYGFPPFLVQRIALELERNLAESVTLPDSDWADMQTDSVQDAWDNFLKAIRAETRIPASYMRSVVENAVEDVLDLMAEPEQMVLDTLFRTEDAATISELEVRRPWIVVNRYLADAIVRYMARRGMHDISRRKAIEIVRQVDKHLATTYTPLKWGQALSHWFELIGEAVPAPMLVRYFTDQGLSAMAQRFEQSDEMIGKSRLIEILSKPDLEWADPDDDFSTISYHKDSNAEAPLVIAAEASPFEQPEPVEALATIDEPEPIESPFDLDEPNLIESPFDFDKQDSPESKPISQEETVPDTSSDIPIWQRFADSQSISQSEEEAAEESPSPEPATYAFANYAETAPLAASEEYDMPEESDENVIYLSEEAKILLTYLNENKDSFVEALFRNDEASFYNSLNELVQYYDWATAGRYITRDIFARNRVDMYSDQAVGYLDAVQQYFDENVT